MNNLSADQQHFFQQLSEIAFSNPFARERETLECRLIGRHSGNMDADQRELEIQNRARFHFQQLQQHKPFNIRQFTGESLEILKFSWLFYIFHELQHEFDLLIESQAQQGDVPVEFTATDQCLDLFDQAGFRREECAKYIALFYQLRRGFNFISQAISGNCPSIVELRIRLWNNIFTFNPEWYLKYLCERMEDFSTLLLGPTGTGKSLVAHAIGCSGFIPFDIKKRRFKESFTGSFQAINLSQYPTGLLESELFGHKKGAFTGAMENHQGLFSRCSAYGAVFIDEIGDIEIPTQLKLLTVIQDRVFSPVGSHEKHRFEGRVIGATNRDLQQLRSAGKFRNDFYYRLCSDVIEIPSLQQRLLENPGELRALIERLLQRVLPETDRDLVKRMEKRILAAVPDGYHWPGNVRELEQCIRRICLTGTYQGDPQQSAMKEELFIQSLSSGNISAQQLLQSYCRHLYDRLESYEAVARVAKMDRRTVKKYIVEEKLD